MLSVCIITFFQNSNEISISLKTDLLGWGKDQRNNFHNTLYYDKFIPEITFIRVHNRKVTSINNRYALPTESVILSWNSVVGPCKVLSNPLGSKNHLHYLQKAAVNVRGIPITSVGNSPPPSLSSEFITRAKG